MKKIIGIKQDAGAPADKNVAFAGFQKSSQADEPQAELTEALVYESLKGVYDPEIPVSIVDLGLIYDAQISGRNVHLKMTLTTPGCGMGAMIAKQAEAAVKGAGAKHVLVEIVWDPPWNPDMMSDEARQKLGID
ncbi:MAG: metal-sulfur cluster assembly factor [Deltaproteobacteria bacterium]